MHLHLGDVHGDGLGVKDLEDLVLLLAERLIQTAFLRTTNIT